MEESKNMSVNHVLQGKRPEGATHESDRKERPTKWARPTKANVVKATEGSVPRSGRDPRKRT